MGEALAWAEQEGVEDPYAIAAIRLLVFTGCRLNEIMTLKWGYVDFKGRCLRLPDSKTGARVVHLGAPALNALPPAKDKARLSGALLDADSTQSVGVFCGTGKVLTDLPRWRAVRSVPALLIDCPGAA